MKLIYLFTLTFCIHLTAFAQWKNATPLGSSINDIQFTNRNTGYAICTSTAIGNCSSTTGPLNLYRTIDGGDNWILSSIGYTANFSAIHFIDEMHGWVAGTGTSYIFGTSNGGQTWASLANTIATGVNDIHFTTLQNGFIVGNGGALRKTTNGGASWQTISAGGVTANLNKIYFYNSQLGFITCGNGQIIRTTNGGNTWSALSTPSSVLNNVFFTSTQVGYATGYVSNGYAVLKSIDGGINWSVLQALTVGGNPLNRITFTTPQDGYIVSSGNGIFITHDAGNTWSQVFTKNGKSDNLNSIYFIDQNIGFICGTGGKIYKTIDAGNTWNSCTTGATGAFYSVCATDKKTAYSGGYSGTILKTENGGLNWKLKAQLINGASTINKIQFVNDSIGLACSDTGRIYKTIDAGENWTLKPTNTVRGINDLSFINEDTGYAACTDGIILKTFDGGETWDSISTSNSDGLVGVFFTNTDTGFAISYNKIYRTFNAGNTWSITNTGTQNVGSLNDIVFINDSLGYCAGIFGKLLKTEDAGLNWSPANNISSNAEIHEISAVNDKVLYFARLTSQYSTNDSGKTLTMESTACLQNNYSMHGISMTNNGNTGFCTGGLGNTLVHIKEELELETIVNSNTYCAGNTIQLACIGRGYLQTGATIQFELSSAGGSFTSPTVIGSYTPLPFVYQSGIINAVLPSNLAAGNYRIRAVSTTPYFVGADNGFDIYIQSQFTPSVQMLNNIIGTACPGTMFTFNTSTFAAGQNPSFKWFVNGVDINNNSSIYYTDTLQDNDVVNVMMTSNLGCVSTAIDTANAFTAHILPFSITTSADDTICKYAQTQISVVGGTSFFWSPNDGLNNPLLMNPIASPNQTTNYSVLATDANGCTATDSVTVYVHPTPDDAIQQNDTAICGATTIQLQAIGGNQYNWYPSLGLDDVSSSNPIATLSASQDYYVQVTNAFGCSSLDSINIQILSIPSNAIATSDTTYCGNGNLQLQASGGVQYAWLPTTGLNNANISNPIANINNSIQYTVLVTAANGCTNRDTIQVTHQNNITLPILQMVNTSVCPNTTFYLVAYDNPSYQYQWSSNGVAIPFPTISTSPMSGINANATFYLTVTNTNTSCYLIDSVQVSVYNYQTQFPIISENAGVLSCTPAHFYQWYLDSVPIANGLQQTYTPTAEGIYSVAVYDSAVCDYYTSAGFNYVFTSISNNKSIDESIEVFPNPTNHFITVQTSGNFVFANITIINALGEIVFSKTNAKESESIDISMLPEGIYILKSNSLQTKFIKL
jgi:photosystem II stability/assembly factor-like uncharacterized protein